ncbi:MAG: Flp pilus assembly complex ATPase component TadA [Chthoniobacterales bacterium]|nr:Flp pilus assembly complex ATPase component TadA [Chthoniobacterales bacterium]
MPPNDDFVLDLLRDGGLVTRTQIDDARAHLNGTSSVVEMLVREGAVSADDVSRSIAAQTHMHWVDISEMIVPPDVINEIQPAEARRFRMIPIARNEATLVVATGDPLDFDSIDSLTYVLKCEVELVCTSPEKIREALVKYYGTADEAADNLLRQIGDAAIADLDLEDVAELAEGDTGDAPIVRMVSLLLLEAHKLGASDIHLEPLEKSFRVRFRIDGVLQEMQSPPKKLQSAIISRLKIMTGSMSIAEKRLPQDGRIQVKMGRKSIDLRVSTVPTNHGESMVMRLLDKTNLLLGLPELGFLSDDEEIFERLLRAPDGILLVTGPTGSGKTSTLYACLHYINKPDRKIITVEEPVEYQMNGINQVQVNSDIGMTFPAALRSILRQAPNIIMIGEIRDLETASIAINASLTGHLVFSTLHTNDAPSAIARLIDIGVQPFLVATSIRAIMAQRLVRRLCTKCKEPGQLSDSELRALRIEASQMDEANVLRPVGCERCRQTGYKGRMGIFEIFEIDDEVRHMVNDRASTLHLRQRARELGMRTLREDGVRKVLAGLTSAEEVISITMGDLN